jgi:hypothetical protein
MTLASFLRREFQDGLQQPMLRVAYRELSGVNSNSNTTRTGGKVVARQCALPALI